MLNRKIATYLDPSQPVEARVADLLAQMTVDEKLAQLGSAWVYELMPVEEKAASLMANGIGHITRIGGASNLPPDECAVLANKIQKYLAEETRLGIPAIVHEESCSGFMARGATSFPQAIGVASAWEPELVTRMSSVIRRQIRAAGGHHGLAPVLDVARDPRWGRVEETFGEDPYLIATLGTAYVRGLQGESWEDRVVATLKHFAAHGVPDGGLNWNPVHIPAREMREVFLAPFEAAVKVGGALSVMNAYHEIDGIPCAASKELLTDILVDEWGFDGVVVSDYFAVNQIQVVHNVAADKLEAARLALEAGIDSELPSTDCYGGPLKEALEKGTIPMELVDRSVGRMLKMKFQLGLFENPYVDEDHVLEVFDTAEDRALAREIALKGIVLLKNEGDLLPLRTDIQSIAVIGPNADSKRHLLGDYAFPSHIETLIENLQKNPLNMALPDPALMRSADDAIEMRTALEAIKMRAPEDVTIRYAQGCEVNSESTDGFAEAVAAARESDVALLFLGDKSGLTDSSTSGETRDRVDIGLPGVQQRLLEAVHATGTPVVVVMNTGRPLAITWMAENVPAILEMWLPGEEGAEAITAVLFGDENPGGKLPITFPRHVGQIPTYYYHKSTGGRSHWKDTYVSFSNKPLYPFGFGLSYTQFEVSNLRLDRNAAKAGETIQITADVANTGKRAGAEVVQLYVRDHVASITRPVKELKGFKRVALGAGEKRSVTFALHINQLGFYGRDMKYLVEPGGVRIMVGTSSEDLPLMAEIEVTGECTPIEEKVFFSEARVE